MVSEYYDSKLSDSGARHHDTNKQDGRVTSNVLKQRFPHFMIITKQDTSPKCDLIMMSHFP